MAINIADLTFVNWLSNTIEKLDINNRIELTPYGYIINLEKDSNLVEITIKPISHRGIDQLAIKLYLKSLGKIECQYHLSSYGSSYDQELSEATHRLKKVVSDKYRHQSQQDELNKEDRKQKFYRLLLFNNSEQ